MSKYYSTTTGTDCLTMTLSSRPYNVDFQLDPFWLHVIPPSPSSNNNQRLPPSESQSHSGDPLVLRGKLPTQQRSARGSWVFVFFNFFLHDNCVSWPFRWFFTPPRSLSAAASVWGGASVVRSDPCRRKLWARRRWRTGVWSNQTTPSQHGPWLHDVQVNSAHCPPVCLSLCLSDCLHVCLSVTLTSMCAGLTWTWWRWSSSATCSGSSSPSFSSPGQPGEWLELQVPELKFPL